MHHFKKLYSISSPRYVWLQPLLKIYLASPWAVGRIVPFHCTYLLLCYFHIKYYECLGGSGEGTFVTKCLETIPFGPINFYSIFPILLCWNLQFCANFIEHLLVSAESQLSFSQRPVEFMLLQEELWFGNITQRAAKKVTTVTTITCAPPTVTSA